MNIHKILFMANLFIIFIAKFPPLHLQLNRMQAIGGRALKYTHIYTRTRAAQIHLNCIYKL